MITPKYELKPIEIGTKSGSWTCISKAFKEPDKFGDQLRIRVRCVCGNEQDLHKHAFKYIGKNRQCYNCGRKASASKHRNGFGDVSGKYLSSVKLGAKRRGLIFDVTAEQLWQKFLDQNKKCALSDIDLIMDYDNRNSNNTASLDRIDSTKGYIISNVQWIHKDINIMKWDYTQEEFIKFCLAVAEKAATFVGG